MITRFVLTVCLSLLFVNISIADDICPGSNKNPPPSGADELKMFEHQFTFQHALDSIDFLEKDVIKILKNHKDPHSVLSYEGFYLGYPNSIKFVKGALLKQEVLIAKNNLEISKLKMEIGAGSKGQITQAEEVYLEAKNSFCGFLKNAEYVD